MNRRGFLGRTLVASLAFMGVATARTTAQDRTQATIAPTGVPAPNKVKIKVWANVYANEGGGEAVSVSRTPLTVSDIFDLIRKAKEWCGADRPGKRISGSYLSINRIKTKAVYRVVYYSL